MAGYQMDDYVPVNERIAAFIKKHPEGSLQSEIAHHSDHLIVMKAYAYRSPDDPRPGIGYSSLEIPGKTNFTRGSEIENAETSAWGRAIAALGFEVKKGIASREEVQNKQDDGSQPRQRRQGSTAALRDAAAKPTTNGGPDWTAFWRVARPNGWKDGAMVLAKAQAIWPDLGSLGDLDEVRFAELLDTVTNEKAAA